jgi:nucleoside phosphorylase
MAGGEGPIGGSVKRVDLVHLPMPEAEIFGRHEESAWLVRCRAGGLHNLARAALRVHKCGAKTAPPPVAPPAPLPPSPPPAQRDIKPVTTPTKPLPVDLGIVIALPEELRAFLALTSDYAPDPTADLDSYLFTRAGYRCAVTLVGEMGETQASMFTERLISALDPTMIVSIGIAGGVHDDLRAGDVHVPSQAVQYIQDAKASPGQGGGFEVVPGAPAYRADYALLKAVRAFEFTHRARHEKWVADGSSDLAELLPDAAQREGLVAGEITHGEPKLLADGHVATGPVVGAAPAFPAWIKTHDRNVKSLEMESAAVLLAAQTRSQPKRALAIRGISDKGDADKSKLDQIEDGVLRKYAMRNAVRLLFAMLDAQALPRTPR